MIKLTQLIKAWEELHVKDIGEIGFCDLDRALTNAGIVIQNDIPIEQPESRKTRADEEYTQIKDSDIRTKVCELMSEMLDNPDDAGIYPTSKFMSKMETYIIEVRDQARAEERGET